MSKVTFDGVNKRIHILAGYDTIDVMEDLYSEWKRWLKENPDNMKYPPAFRTFGGDPTAGGQVAPRYFFLINGWRIVVDGISITVQTNLYTDEGDSPFIIKNGGSVTNKTSDVPVVNTSSSCNNSQQLDTIENKINNILQYVNTILDIEEGNWEIKDNKMIFYDRNNSPLLVFKLYDKYGNPSETNVYKRERV